MELTLARNELAATASVLDRESLADNTRRAYGRALDRLNTWLADNGLALSDEGVADYLSYLFDADCAPRTAEQVVAAVRFVSKATGCESLVGPQTRRRLAGFRRAGRSRGRGQAAGIQWVDADRIARAASSDGLTGLRDAAVIAIMSDGLLRVSEAAAVQVDHVTITDTGATLTIPHSKTDQEGAGAVQYLGPATVDHVRRWQKASGITGGPLFRRVYRETVGAGITAKTVTRIIQRRAGECGIDGVSGHSLRVGSAQALASAGASLVEMQMEGRWQSPRMPAHYSKSQMADRRATARLRYGVSGGA